MSALERLLQEAVVRPSPNFDERRRAICQIVLHYTGMKTAEEALARLTSREAKVSAHFCIDEAGGLWALVPPEKRAWHAGVACWRGESDINSSSLGIELVNPGHAWGYRPFPEAQMGACVQLVAALKEAFHIRRADVIGHSDVAPARKEDPGELFPWERLAAAGLALGRPADCLPDPGWGDAVFLEALQAFGYDVRAPLAAVVAFQRRFRPARLDGVVDGETRAILATLRAAEESTAESTGEGAAASKKGSPG